MVTFHRMQELDDLRPHSIQNAPKRLTLTVAVNPSGAFLPNLRIWAYPAASTIVRNQRSYLHAGDHLHGSFEHLERTFGSSFEHLEELQRSLLVLFREP